MSERRGRFRPPTPWLLLRHRLPALGPPAWGPGGAKLAPEVESLPAQRRRLAKRYDVRVEPLSALGLRPFTTSFRGEPLGGIRKRSPQLTFPWVREFSRVLLSVEAKGAISEILGRLRQDVGVYRVELVPVPIPCAPLFRDRQGYLDDTPDGVGLAALGPPPPSGDHLLRVIDIEGDWCLDHEAFSTDSEPAILAGEPHGESVDERSHGTAVLAAIAGRGEASKVEGLAPTAEIHVASYWSGDTYSISAAIRTAAPYLGPGDIMLIEAQIFGPAVDENDRINQRGCIPVEWTEDVFLAVKDVTDAGIVVVAASGNGEQNLDDDVYEGRFDRSKRDSGTIFVGAGEPPGSESGARVRASFSDYGSCVDVQAWGGRVVTAGYGDLQGPSSGLGEQSWYTAEFSGTSSASAIVAGVLARVQQHRMAAGKKPLSPAAARSLLRQCGSAPASPAVPDQGIGLQPNLPWLVKEALSLP